MTSGGTRGAAISCDGPDAPTPHGGSTTTDQVGVILEPVALLRQFKPAVLRGGINEIADAAPLGVGFLLGELDIETTAEILKRFARLRRKQERGEPR